MTTPADIIAATRARMVYARNYDGYGSNCSIEAPLGEVNAAIVAALDAAGYDIVARDPRLATCPTGCHNGVLPATGRGSDGYEPCSDPWHGGAE